ncbi:MAG: PKD domain-containing protein [bacterium]|nr:PKD domain-containing protein [bacterium]
MHRHLLVVGFAVAASAAAQTPINMPAFVSTYVAPATRGFWFTCPVDCVITGLEAPNEASQPAQVLEVLDFGTTAPVSFPATSAAVSQLFYDNSTAAGTKIATSIPLTAGRIYGVFGCCTAAPGSVTTYSSYGAATFSTDILGNSVPLMRLITQSGIASNGGNQPCSASTGPIGRALVDIAPAAGLYAGFIADITAGVAPLAVQFTDTSTTDASGGIASWAWDFENDGTIDSTLQNPSHVFSTCGDFDVALTVTDGTNPPATTVVTAAVRTDLLDAGFQVTQLSPPNVWQFTDMTTPAPTAWAWDFDDDGTVDSTLQNPTLTSVGSCLDTTVTLSVTRGCRNASVTEPVFVAGSVLIGPTAGGNALTSATAVGNYFDLTVTAPAGVLVCGLTVAPHAVAGPFDLAVYLTEDTHLGKEGNATFWRQVGSGTGESTGGGFVPPDLANVALDEPFYLPSGAYGLAVFLSTPSGMGIAYTNGPVGPFAGPDLVLHPNGVGSSADSELGNVAFADRLWNGAVHYQRCSVAGEAGRGFFGTGCVGALGVPRLDPVGTTPRLGTTYRLDVTNVPNGLAVMVLGLSHTFSPIFGALPYDGTAAGAPGCLLRVNGDIIRFLSATGTTATWTLSIPNNPALTCLPLFTQAVVLSNGTNALGFVASDAWAAVVGQ